MTHSSSLLQEQIQAFVEEMIGFSDTAEKTLKEIELNLLQNKALFLVFAERMLTIRGTAEQLGLPVIAHIAELSEEISMKASQAEAKAVLRKCVGSLWDAQGTIKYLLEHYSEETHEEQSILMNRLQASLKSLGGARPSIDAAGIDALLKSRG